MHIAYDQGVLPQPSILMEQHKTVTHLDRMYSPEAVKQISELRQERWALYAALALQPTRKKGTVFTQKVVTQIEKRIQVVNKQLFALTENEIYNV